MLCALLRAIKIFFVGNTLFSSHATVHLDRNMTLAAITYHLEHNALHIDHTVTLVQDARYYACFKDHPHTVTDRYLFLGPELKEKLLHLERMPFLVGGSRLAPCLHVNPYTPPSSKEHNEEVEHRPASVLPKTVLPTKELQKEREDSERNVSPSVHPTPRVHPSPRIRPLPRFTLQKNTTPPSDLLVTNTTLPQWTRSTPGRTIQPNRTISSRPENHTSTTGISTHNESIVSTELILGSTRVWARRPTHSRHRLPDRNVTLGDFDRVLSLMNAIANAEEEGEWESESDSEEESEK